MTSLMAADDVTASDVISGGWHDTRKSERFDDWSGRRLPSLLPKLRREKKMMCLEPPMVTSWLKLRHDGFDIPHFLEDLLLWE